MNDEILFSASDLGWILAAGAVVLLVLLVARTLLKLLPLSKSARVAVSRIAPIVNLAVALGYLGFVVRVLFRQEGRLSETTLVSVLLGLLLIALVAVSWSSIRDFVSGVVVKVGQVVREGDYVRIGDTQGRVVRLGQRSILIEATDGSEVVLPYTGVAGGMVRRSPSIDGASIHVFELEIPRDAKLPELKRTIRESALRSHWSSVVLDPKVEPAGSDRLEVTVYPLHDDYAPDVEAAVRGAIPSPKPTKRAPPSLGPDFPLDVPKVTPPKV